jgi:hypothetical protein
MEYLIDQKNMALLNIQDAFLRKIIRIKFQIFSKDQLENCISNTNNDIFLDHCFVNCLKYYKIKDEIIEYAKDIILDVFPIKNLNKLCKALNIVVNL